MGGPSRIVPLDLDTSAGIPRTPSSTPNWSALTEPQWQEGLKGKGVPDMFLAATLENLPAEARGALSGVGERSVLFYGDTGRGKTYAMAGLFRRLIPGASAEIEHYDALLEEKQSRSEVSARWLDVPLWLYQLRQSFHGGEEPPVSVKDACEVALLCLDDVGAENVSDWTSETLYIVVSQREAYKLQTLTTTNMSPADLRSWNPRLASRLMAYKRVAMSGDDRRLRNGK